MAVLLYGCAAGPDFVRPTPPEVHRYTASQTPLVIAPETGEPRQHIRIGQEISSQWWDLFRVPALSDVLRSAVERNRTIAAARATLAAARETVAAAKGGFFPQVDISADADRSKGSGGTQISNLYSLGATVSYRAGCVRRYPAQGGTAAGARGISRLRTGRRLPDPHRQRRDPGHHHRIPALSDSGDRRRHCRRRTESVACPPEIRGGKGGPDRCVDRRNPARQRPYPPAFASPATQHCKACTLDPCRPAAG